MIKAIETRYKGYRFRSRLEARWAVFFDALGIKYKYEEYGFEKNGYRWMPDFYLPEYATWVEVKGGRPSNSDAEKMGKILDFDSPVPFFSDSKDSSCILPLDYVDQYKEIGGENAYNVCRGLLLLGEIPNVTHGITLHSFIRHYEGLYRTCSFFAGSFVDSLTEREASIMKKFTGEEIPLIGEFLDGYGEAGSNFSIDFFTPYSAFYPTYLANREVCKAYQKARSARFEHGETPQ